LLFYKAKNYQKAYKVFEKLLKSNYKSLNYNFYYGMCCEKLKKYNQAIAAFERILIYSPKNIRAKLELGKIYFILKKYKQSKKYFLAALSQTKNEKVKKNIQKYLNKIYNFEKHNLFSATAIIGSFYDSNVKSSPDNDNWSIYIGDTPVEVNNTTPKYKEIGFNEILLLNHKYFAKNYIYSGNFLIYNKTYPNVSSSNVFVFKFSPSIQKGSNKYSLMYTYIKFGGVTLMNQYGVGYNFYDDYYNFGINYIYKNYLDNKKDSKYIEINNNFYKKLSSKNKLNTLISIQFQRSNSNDPTMDYNLLKCKITDNYLINKTIQTKFFTALSLKKYILLNPLYNDYQYDKKLVFGTSFMKMFKKFIFQLNARYTKNNSNFASSEYSQWNVGCNFIIPLYKGQK